MKTKSESNILQMPNALLDYPKHAAETQLDLHEKDDNVQQARNSINLV